MANIVTSINYANTFGEWVNATDNLITENNSLASQDYTKDTGTLYLNETTKNSLQANGSVVIQKQLRVQGLSSSAIIDNNLQVGGTLNLTNNNTISLISAGQANIGGILVVLGSDIGLNVSNSAYIGDNITIENEAIANTIQANNSVNTSIISATGSIYGSSIHSNNLIESASSVVSGDSITNTLSSNTSISTNTLKSSLNILTNSIQANTNIVTDVLKANTNIVTDVLKANTNVLTNTLQANTSTNTQISSVTQTSYADKVQANTSILTGILQANTSTNTATASVTGTIFTKVLQANTSINTPTASVTGTTFTDVLQANTSTNTATASITGTTFTKVLQANTSINTPIISVSNSVITKDIQANNIISTPNLLANTITANISASIPTLTVSTKFDGNNASGFLNSLQVQGGGLTVNGNFILTGTTVYASNTFQLSTGITSAVSSYLQVSRGISGANAAIRWNEPSLYWETLDVTGNLYSRIVTEDYLANQTGSYANTAFLKANAAYTQANTATSNAGGASLYANGAFIQANAAFAAANNVAPQVQPIFNQANAAFLKANSSYALANTFANTFVGTTGSVSQSSGVISFSSNNGVAIVATAANNLAVSTSQDLRSTASPTFVGASFSQPITATTMAAGTSNTALATTAYVQNLANNSGTLTTSITGNAGTVTNGVYTNQSYADPSWITSLANTKISGVITGSQLASTTVTTGTYGGAAQHTVVTVDQQGRITYAANVIPSIANTQITGTITASQLSPGAANTNIGYTPYNAANPNGYQTNSGNVATAGAFTSGNWVVSQSGTKINFIYGGVTVFSIDSNGNIVAKADVTGYSTP